MRVPLYLSKRKAKKSIYVPVKITEHLHLYQIDIIRFIYRSYLKKINVVLNVDNTTNKPLQICAFMSAVKPFPALLILPDDDIEDWYREIQIKTQFSTSILKDPKETILGIDDVTLVGHDKLKRMSNLKTVKWNLFLIDDIEEVIKVGCIKKIDAKFQIAATNYDFIRNPNYQFQKDILKWLKYNGKISKRFTLLNSEFWLRKSQGNKKDENDVQQSGIESAPIPPSGFQTKNKTNSKKAAEKKCFPNKPKDNVKSDNIIENPFSDSPIDFSLTPEILQNNEKSDTEENNVLTQKNPEDISNLLDDNKLIEKPENNEKNLNKSQQKRRYKKIIENFSESQEEDNKIIPKTPVKYHLILDNHDKPSTSGLSQKNGMQKKQKFSFDDKPNKKSKKDKHENNLKNGANTIAEKSLEKQTQIICTTESDRVLAEVLDVNSQILDVEDVLIKNTPRISASPENNDLVNSPKVIVEEMEPDPILDALFFSSIKSGDEDNKMTIKDNEVIENKNDNTSDDETQTYSDNELNKIPTDAEKSSICENTETEKLLDMLFSF